MSEEPEIVDPSEVGGIPGLSGLPDLGGLFEQAARMQEQLMAAQETAAATVIEGQSGGGAVKISVTGAWEFEDVRIDPGVVDPDDPELLADLVLAALRDATAQITDMQRGSIGGLDLGDVNLGGLGGIGGALGDT
jgi:DNA-binding YbaB/EbfC family protein